MQIPWHAPACTDERPFQFIALAVEHDFKVHQMDVKTAHLNADLEETLYMLQPECFEAENNPDMVCLLNNSIYGLKQAGRA